MPNKDSYVEVELQNRKQFSVLSEDHYNKAFQNSQDQDQSNNASQAGPSVRRPSSTNLVKLSVRTNPIRSFRLAFLSFEDQFGFQNQLD